jgi:hypothetical protein
MLMGFHPSYFGSSDVLTPDTVVTTLSAQRKDCPGKQALSPHSKHRFFIPHYGKRNSHENHVYQIRF